jgi:hypothetical protein
MLGRCFRKCPDQLLSPEAVDLLAEVFPEVSQQNLFRIVSYSQTLVEMPNDYAATDGTFTAAPGRASIYFTAVKGAPRISIGTFSLPTSAIGPSSLRRWAII